MAVFPVLSIAPSKVEQTYEDSTIRSEFESGFELTRNKFTRDRSTFAVEYEHMQRIDKDILVAFLKEVRGSTAFDWTNPDDGLSYQVRFSSFPTIPAVAGMFGIYSISFEIKEV